MISERKDKLVSQFKERKQLLDSRFGTYYPALFFLGGFIYDIATLDRIDSSFNIAQQVAFLILSSTGLTLTYLHEAQFFLPSEKLKKVWGYKDEALHFLLGSLLSVYTLFYVKSASAFSSFLFILILFGILIFNENSQARKLKLPFKWALLQLCILSFLIYVSPMIIGQIGWLSFILTLVLGCIVNGLGYLLFKKMGLPPRKILLDFIRPFGFVYLGFIVLYFLNWIPPVPLSIQHIGIYHNVEKVEGRYQLTYYKPFWKFWHNSDQDFLAFPGDKVFAFSRIFSPVGFQDQVHFHWLKKGKSGYETVDKIPVAIRGGRSEGFRAFTQKSNFDPGQWLLKIETLDGREIGRTLFEVKIGQGQPEEAKTRTF